MPLKLAAEYEKYVTPRTIADLDAIRDKLEKAHLNVGDFQFIVRRSDGAVFVNDPVSVTPNSAPSGKLKEIIDRFRGIQRRNSKGNTE